MEFALFLLLCVSLTGAFVPEFATRSSLALKMGYVPDGMSPEQYRKMRAKEKDSASKKKFGAFGPQSFQSRSLQSFQQDMEKGKTGHLMPVMNAKALVKKGKLRPEDVPYMQRGGSWDNSDVASAKKVKWSAKDKAYSSNSAPAKVDWTGRNDRKGPAKAKGAAAKQKPQTKKLFGLF